MKVSVIIVSYNVYPFLDNCLRSVQQALRGIDGEIIVVDNASVDQTPHLVAHHFPEVRLISNSSNPGFAKANNQGIEIARGEYILLLNPDTLVSEDTIEKCLQFMEIHSEAGAVGVRMMDGSGQYLPESKRGLPTLRASFMKMTGLYRLFPTSKFWNSYYAGHIDIHKTAQIQVLTGAYMFIRRTVLDTVGWLDESFFMYGEDIDLSYRITKGGYAIYYYPETEIIHYKGESTRKASLNYFLTFYKAMLIFAAKHAEFRGQQPIIRMAIYLHGVFRYCHQTILRILPALMDAFLLAASLLLVSTLWARLFYNIPHYFHGAFYAINLPLYICIAIFAQYLSGAYDKPVSQRHKWAGWFAGMIAVFVIYAFLPSAWRTSRAVILIGFCVYGIVSLLVWPALKSSWLNKKKRHSSSLRHAVIVANSEEALRIRELINRSSDKIEVKGVVTPLPVEGWKDSVPALGHLAQLGEIVRVHHIDEIIFSAQDIPFSSFTKWMSDLGPAIRYMLAASTTMSIVGSMHRDTSGESYGLRVIFNLSHPATRRSKRIFDIITSSLMLIMLPLLIWKYKNPGTLVKNILHVLIGNRTWVSYHESDDMKPSLPQLKPGILSPVYPDTSPENMRKTGHIEYVYARDYHWTTDLTIVSSQWKRLDQTYSHDTV